MFIFRGKSRVIKTGFGENQAELVIGDVHGCAAQLRALLMSFVPDKPTHLTFLGDLIDRGPDSLDCIRTAFETCTDARFAGVTLLTGNHEAMMLAGMDMKPACLEHYDIREAYETWFHNGGDTVLDSIEREMLAKSEGGSYKSTELETVIGPDALRFLLNAKPFRRTGSLLLCHAGIDPRKTIDEWFAEPEWPIYSEDSNWCWIRRPFLFHSGEFPENVTVVHGHTFEFKVALAKKRKNLYGADGMKLSAIHAADGRRLGLDGGSFSTGIVTAALFEKGRYRIFAAADEKMAAAAKISLS